MMKKYFLLLAASIAALVSVSCTNNDGEVLAVRLDKTKIELVKGESLQLKAKVVPDQNAEFTWFSEDENYVKVDQNGVVTAVGLKKAAEDSDEVASVSVYVKYLNGADECQVTVLPLAPSKVEIEYDEEKEGALMIDPAQSIQLVAKCYPEDADLTDITWSSDYAAVAKIDSKTGVLTGVTAGWAKIRASYNETIYDEINVTVRKIEAEKVQFEPASHTMSVGTRKRLTVKLTPENATGTLLWTSLDLDVAKVDSETGLVEAIAPGTATIKVQIDKVYATCEVTVVE